MEGSAYKSYGLCKCFWCFVSIFSTRVYESNKNYAAAIGLKVTVERQMGVLGENSDEKGLKW